jgi:hypothetical protein
MKLPTRLDGKPLTKEQWLRGMYERALFASDFQTMDEIKYLWDAYPGDEDYLRGGG